MGAAQGSRHGIEKRPASAVKMTCLCIKSNNAPSTPSPPLDPPPQFKHDAKLSLLVSISFFQRAPNANTSKSSATSLQPDRLAVFLVDQEHRETWQNVHSPDIRVCDDRRPCWKTAGRLPSCIVLPQSLGEPKDINEQHGPDRAAATVHRTIQLARPTQWRVFQYPSYRTRCGLRNLA